MFDLLRLLTGVSPSGDGWTARCPAHEDRHNSLSIARGGDRWLIKCHAGCDCEQIVDALGSKLSDLFDVPLGGGGPLTPSVNRATVQPSSGLTLSRYATAKALPIEFLRTCGLAEFSYDKNPAIRIPYLGVTGEELAVRFRIALEGDRFRWKSGTKPCLYGLHRIGEAREAGHVVLVEGESDCHTLWFHRIPALGIPGATNWREDRDAPQLDGIETIYVVIESDRGGEAVRKWIARSTIRHRTKLLTLPTKDPSALYLQDPAAFTKAWQVALLGAMPWSAVEAETNATERAEAWETCACLARSPSILDEFATALSHAGVVGERRATKLIYLALTSRLLDRPVSIAVKGPSSGGKSFIVDSTLRFFPSSAFYSLTAMSDRALAYSAEPLQHRHLVIYEAAGMTSDFATYLIRSLLSEGRLRYETVEKTKDGLVPKLIEREGPTGLIVTTTSLRLHPENETRLLSITVTDTQEQTAAVFKALARQKPTQDVDLSSWVALQIWIATGASAVSIPYAERLAELVPPVAVRLRRDFRMILTLISAHALLHQASRQKDDAGQVVATIEDYACVRELVADLAAEGVEITVKPEVREIVEKVAQLIERGADEVRQADLKTVVRLDKSAISRRINAALDAGYLKNLEERKGRPARIVMGDPLPIDQEILPPPAKLLGSDQLRSCAVDGGELGTPPPGAVQPGEPDDEPERKWTVTL